ncbi:MAG TPA: ABC transporter ATP-binding protein [Cellulomonas sp.]
MADQRTLDAGAGLPPALAVRGLTKRYGDLVANDAIDLTVRPGEIHALLGENGAGKSTLVRVLAGLTVPDAGRVQVGGVTLPPGDADRARALGIGVVHQHFMLVPDLTAAENVALALHADQPWRLRLPELADRLAGLGARHGLPVHTDDPVGMLPVGERQRIEILKCLMTDARVLLLDEPSAVLSPDEWDRLAAVLRQLCGTGMAVVLITHKLGEIAAVADRCTVVRSGRVVATVPVAGTAPAELARMMVGREVELTRTRALVPPGPTVLRADGVGLARYRGDRDLGPMTFEVRGGEVLGIAGVEGNGQSELADLLAGVRAPTTGAVTVLRRDGGGSGVVGVIPEDRHAQGLALPLSLTDNLMMRDIATPRFSRWGVVRSRRVVRHCAGLLHRYGIRARGPQVPADQLSGGNQQKVVVARELSREPDLLLAVQPTRGLDVGAVEFVHEQIEEHKRAGGATVLVSAELDEIFGLADRVAVLAAGQLVAVLGAAEATRERVGELMAAGDRAADGDRR